MIDKIATFDIEGVNDESEIFGNVFSIGCLYDGAHSTFSDTIPELVDSFISHSGVIYAHYGADYDFKLIFKYIMSNFFVKVKVLNNKIGCIKAYKDKKYKKKIFELRDTQFLLSASLKKLGIAFNSGIKMDVDRSKIKNLTREQEREYVLSDCKILYDTLDKFLSEVGVTDKVPPLTLPSIAFSRWKSMFDERRLRISARYDPDIRKAYYGGRVDVFHRYGQDLKHYDVNSMYPTAMVKYDYPEGGIIRVKKYIEDKLGVYHCEIDATDIKNPEYPFLPYREKSGKLLFPLGTWTGWYCSPEIDKAISLGYKVKVIEGYAFRGRCRPFKDYVSFFHKMKNNNKGVKRTIAKLFLNSLYGKFGQRRFFKKVIQQKLTKELIKRFNVFPLMPEFNLYQMEVEDNKPFSYVQISAFVTCYARIILYEWFEEVLRQGGKLFYCDTDSIVCDRSLKTSKELGGMDLESMIKEAIFLNPKTYGYITLCGHEVIKAKGFNVKSLEYEDYIKAFDNDLSGFNTKKAGLVGFFEAVKRKLAFDTPIFRTRTMVNLLTKRNLMCDNIYTTPVQIYKGEALKD